jgi:hypothetical protein
VKCNGVTGSRFSKKMGTLRLHQASNNEEKIMMQNYKLKLFILFFVMLLISACNLRAPQLTAEQQATYITQTVNAELTQMAFATMVAEAQNTPLPQTSVPTTVVVYTVTPITVPTQVPTQIPTIKPTGTPVPVDWAQFVDDVTIEDGSTFAPGESFVKTWRLRNIGSSTWTTDYALVFVSGNAMQAPAATLLQKNVAPNETVDVSVRLVAPENEGSYTGNFQLRNTYGVRFGIGNSAASSFYVKINVEDKIGEWDDDHPLDFAANYCEARWTSGKGSIGCPSSAKNLNYGSVERHNEPWIEKDYHDDEVAIVLAPSDGAGGYISGRFPPLEVKSGDHFKALVGCMDDTKNCNVMFQLNYVINDGAVQNLGSWTQVYDGSHTAIDVDLSALDGEKVDFILKVLNNNDSSDDDYVFWMVPRIVR